MIRRIGMLTPSSNTVLEPVTAKLTAPLAESISVHYSRFPVNVIADSVESDGQFDLEPMLAAASLLADARVDVIVWNGTSGAWQGISRDIEFTDRIQTQLRTKATTATLALLEMLRRLSVSRYGLVVPYTREVATRIVSTLTAAGYPCADVAHIGLTENFAFAQVSAERIGDLVRQTARSRPDAIVIHCTNMRGADIADALAEDLKVPVLDSVVVALWGALDALGIRTCLPGVPATLQATGMAHQSAE
jgi:maleate isomerase